MSSPNNNNGIKSITELLSEDLPSLQDISTSRYSSSSPSFGSTSTSSSSSGFSNSFNSTSSSIMEFFSSITWQTWIIVILLLALIGINIFSYLAKGTQATATIFDQIFGPILKLFGYTTLETTKQTIETSATGTTAGVNAVANTSVGAINTVEQNGSTMPIPTSGTSVGVSTAVPQGQMATSSQQGVPLKSYEEEAKIEKYKEDTLEKALSNAAQTAGQQGGGGIQPYDANSSVNTGSKSGWCFIGEDLGVRTCSEVGINDVCMSGDVFPSQEICMNPNLRA